MTMTPLMRALFWAAFIFLLIGFFWLFSSVLTPFVLGIAIAYLLDPLMRRLSRRQIPRWVTALLILAAFFLVIGTVFLLTAPIMIRQGHMLIEQIPHYIQSLLDYLNPYLGWIQSRVGQDYISDINNYLKDNAGKLVGMTGGLAAGLASGGKFVMDMATTLALTPLVAFFMMKEWPNIVAWVRDLYPRQHVAVISDLMRQIDTKLAGFIRGQIMVALMLGAIYAVALTLCGLNFGFLIGLGAGIFSIIPLVGSTLGLLVGVLVAWFQAGDISYVGMIAAVFMVGQFIEGNFLSPKLVGDNVGLHPVWVMFALLAGGSLLGLLGMLVAVPVAAIVGVLAGFAIRKYKASQLYLQEPVAVSLILPDEDVTIIIRETDDE